MGAFLLRRWRSHTMVTSPSSILWRIWIWYLDFRMVRWHWSRNSWRDRCCWRYWLKHERFGRLHNIFPIACEIFNSMTHLNNTLFFITLGNEFLALHDFMELSSQIFTHWHPLEVECIIKDSVLSQEVVHLWLYSLDECFSLPDNFLITIIKLHSWPVIDVGELVFLVDELRNMLEDLLRVTKCRIESFSSVHHHQCVLSVWFTILLEELHVIEICHLTC